MQTGYIYNFVWVDNVFTALNCTQLYASYMHLICIRTTACSPFSLPMLSILEPFKRKSMEIVSQLFRHGVYFWMKGQLYTKHPYMENKLSNGTDVASVGR